MNKKILNIRAHHFLCMQGFQGHGYSEKFVHNMAGIIKYIRENSDCKINLINSCDDICSACSNNKEQHCSNKEVDNMDNTVLSKLDIKEGCTINAADAFKLVNRKLKTEEDIKDICGNCRWTAKCLWRLTHIQGVD